MGERPTRDVKREGVAPPRLNIATAALPAGQARRRSVRPARRLGSKPTHVFRPDVEATNSAERVCAGHRPAAQGSKDRQPAACWIPPPGI